ncbi:MAG: hypothetical protein NT062_08705, partial [Proteobacteria bacterium]|nr:hypothetical protein [Pseudomonadota bacterium]
EEQFYLVWPLVERWGGRRAVAIAAVGVAAPLVAVGVASGSTLVGRVPAAILVGVLLAHAHAAPRLRRALETSWRRAPARVVVVGIVVALLEVPGEIGAIRAAALQLAFGLLVSAAVLAPPRSVFIRVLSIRALVALGALSYGLYLLHMLALNAGWKIVGALGAPHGLGLPLGIVLAIVLARAAQRFVERPVLAFRDRESSRGRDRLPASQLVPSPRA